MKEKKTVWKHVTDAAYKMKDGEILEGIRFRSFGSHFGRIIFTNQTLVEIPSEASVTIRNCEFIGNP